MRRKLAVAIALFVPILILSMAGFSLRAGNFCNSSSRYPLCFSPLTTLGGVALIAGVLVFFFGRR